MNTPIKYDFREGHFICQLGTNGAMDFAISQDDWVRQSAFSCDWDLLPESPLISELSRFALLIDGYACMEKLQEIYEVEMGFLAQGDSEGVYYNQFLDRFSVPQFTLAERGEHAWYGTSLELWCSLFAIQRGWWKEGWLTGGKGVWEDSFSFRADPNAKGLWPKLRECLKLNKRFGPGEIEPVYLPICSD